MKLSLPSSPVGDALGACRTLIASERAQSVARLARRSARGASNWRWSAIVETGLVVLLAYLTAQLIWAWAGPDPRPSVPAVGGFAPMAAAARSSGDVAALTRFDPFHRALPAAGSEEARAEEETAPETTLDLELFGVRVSERDDDGSAVIRTLDNRQATFLIGDEIGDGTGVYLRRILADRVVISHKGALESLAFAPAKRGDAPRRQGTAVTPPRGRGRSAPASARAGGAEPELVQLGADVEALMAALEVRPLQDDNQEVVGVLLYPRGDGGLFEQAGLKVGDRLMRLNGELARSSEEAARALEQLRGLDEAEVTVLRGGEEVRLRLGLVGGS